MTAPTAPVRTARPAPYLVWPVSRREFYRTIWISLLPTVAWGAIIFGWRCLLLLLASIAAATLTHTLLKRLSRWRRARSLLYPHTIVTVIVLVALCHPTWPAWPTIAIALLIPFFIALFGGPGRERIHLAVLFVALLQFVLMPYVARQGTYAGGHDAIVARDRLLMGDLRNQRSSGYFQWPNSRELGGDDAIQVPLPALVASETFNRLSETLATAAHPFTWDPEVARPGEGRAPGVGGGGGAGTVELTRQTQIAIHQTLDSALALQLPAIDSFMEGATPGRIGTVSLVAITAAGLYLAYRNILRPHSVVLFAMGYLVVSLLVAFTPACTLQIGLPGLWHVWRTFPSELLTLFEFLILNSDAPFAAVFILALPGTEPLTPRGRHMFLLLAAFCAAILHRHYPLLPAASLTLCTLMPLAGLFDRLFRKPSWLNS